MKKATTRLALKVETVRKLSQSDLQNVVGAGVQTQNFSACQTNCNASDCVCPTK